MCGGGGVELVWTLRWLACNSCKAFVRWKGGGTEAGLAPGRSREPEQAWAPECCAEPLEAGFMGWEGPEKDLVLPEKTQGCGVTQQPRQD